MVRHEQAPGRPQDFWLLARSTRRAASIASVVYPRANETLLPTSGWRRLAVLAMIGPLAAELWR